MEDREDEVQRHVREEIRKGLDAVHERHVTIRITVISSAIVGIAAIIAWAYVKVNAKHSALDVALTLFAPSGVVSLLFSFGFWYLRRRIRSLEDRLPRALRDDAHD